MEKDKIDELKDFIKGLKGITIDELAQLNTYIIGINKIIYDLERYKKNNESYKNRYDKESEEHYYWKNKYNEEVDRYNELLTRYAELSITNDINVKKIELLEEENNATKTIENH
jgi:hypothetical protein